MQLEHAETQDWNAFLASSLTALDTNSPEEMQDPWRPLGRRQSLSGHKPNLLSSPHSSSLSGSSSHSTAELEPMEGTIESKNTPEQSHPSLSLTSPLTPLNEPPPMYTAKSPVIASRRDSATWKLQDEEFLGSPPTQTSPTTNQSPQAQTFDFYHGSLPFFHNNENQLSHEDSDSFENQHSRRSRLKDLRTSSVDFSIQSNNDVRPPLPPRNAINRSRAKSFSYSTSYTQPFGDNGASPWNPSPVDYMNIGNNHGLYSNVGASERAQFQSPHSAYSSSTSYPNDQTSESLVNNMRKLSVDIPQSNQFGNLPSYNQASFNSRGRRYSGDAFTMSSYSNSNNNGNEAMGGLGHQKNTRGVRSYSMEYLDFNSTSRSPLSNDLTGYNSHESQMRMARTHSFDWNHPVIEENAPPLPPNSSPMNTSSYDTLSVSNDFNSPDQYYEVEFKRQRKEIFVGKGLYEVGTYVKVEADRGEDIGVIRARASELTSLHRASSSDSVTSEESSVSAKNLEVSTKRLVGMASQEELDQLKDQRKEEDEVFQVCRSKVRQRLLPMNVIDAEYQFDRHKLTFFFEAERRIDFRELVRDLFAIYKTRIWLQQVLPAGKKMASPYDNVN